MTNNHVNLNGLILTSDEANIKPNDRGFLLGDGIFETIRVDNAMPLHFEKHWQRFTSSARLLGLNISVKEDVLFQSIIELIKRNQLDKVAAGVRVTLTRGCADRGLLPKNANDPTLLITSFKLPDSYISGCEFSLSVATTRRNEYSLLSGIKSINYLDAILAKQEADKKNYDDALLLNTKGNIAETTVANIFFIKNDVIYTPRIEDGVLPGVMRATVIEKAAQQGISLVEQTLDLDFINDCESSFVSNALMGVQVVKRIDEYSYESDQMVIELNELVIDS